MTTWTPRAAPADTAETAGTSHSAGAAAHFATRLAHETDCADVALALAHGPGDHARLVLLDARSREAYDAGHLPGAVRLTSVDAGTLDGFGDDVAFVTYCWGPHCNGATKLAARVAALGFPVREMLGGTWGWQMEGFELVTSDAGATR